jgi:ABC-2 type transport system ATP-binding protein
MIQVQGVSKSYGTTVALDRVTFSVEEKQVLGFLGPNGAGKSTAMKIITTYLSADAGTVTVDGVDVATDPLTVRHRIGYLPETAPLYDEMRVLTYLEFVAQSRGLSGSSLKKRLEWAIDKTGIRANLYKNVNELSKGYRQRVGIAQALVHDPQVLILDEPTSGLDPQQIIGIRNLIAELSESKTVIFSSHILAEVSSVTNRIVVINGGKIVADGQVDELRRQAKKTNRYQVNVGDAGTAVVEAFRGIAGVTRAEALAGRGDDQAILLESPLDRDLRRDINEVARSRGWDLLELSPHEPTLEEAFIGLTDGGRRDA